jgi:hypothetical protein
MKINPGGMLDPKEIVGRDREIARYWSVLERQGLLLGGERRIGKTHVLRKMHEEGHPGFVTVYQELEGVQSLSELVRELYHAVGARLRGAGRFKAAALGLWESLVPAQIKSFDLPHVKNNWKALLKSAVSDALKVVPPEDKLVLIWDEFPLMVHNIKVREGAESAIQLLDVLRHVRQTDPGAGRVRLLLTGSIGLHHVLKSLRAEGNANAPMNDMLSETVPPMSSEDSFILATRLLEEIDPEAARAERFMPLAQEMIQVVGGFPFYLQHVADRLSQLDRPPVVKDIEAAVEALVLAPEDPGNFNYNVERIKTYYEPRDAVAAFAVLGAIAAKDRPMGLSALHKAVGPETKGATTEHLREVCTLLGQDHYLERAPGKKGAQYDFRWPLVKRWWQRHRR